MRRARGLAVFKALSGNTKRSQTVTMANGREIMPGDVVITADGHRLGEVARAEGQDIIVESGLLFRRHYVLTIDEIARYEGSVLTSTLTMDELRSRERR